MRVRFNVDFELSPRAKRVLRFMLPVLVMLVSAVVYAGVPNTFKDGDTLSAQPMNDNFASLDQRLTKLESANAKATDDGGYSVGATYCGSSASTTAGDMSGLSVTGTGYGKARTQCQVTCNSPSAHMCAADELVRSAQLGVTLSTQGWDSSGSATGNGNYECDGWTTNSASFLASIWNDSPPGPSIVDCSKLYPVLCCN
jgi:hypothetical protein